MDVATRFSLLAVSARFQETRTAWIVRCGRVQWLRGRASDSRLREPGFESCAAVLKPLASLFTV